MLRILSHHPNQCFDALNQKREGWAFEYKWEGCAQAFCFRLWAWPQIVATTIVVYGRRVQLLVFLYSRSLRTTPFSDSVPPPATGPPLFPPEVCVPREQGTRCCLPKIVGSTEICSLGFPRSLSLSGFPSHSPSVSLSLCLSAVGRPFSEWLFLASARQCLLRWQSERARLFSCSCCSKIRSFSAWTDLEEKHGQKKKPETGEKPYSDFFSVNANPSKFFFTSERSKNVRLRCTESPDISFDHVGHVTRAYAARWNR